MRVALVAKSGGEYTPEHVDRLVEQIGIHYPFAPVIALTDMPITSCTAIPLKHNWKGWWSKMRLFDPEIEGDLFYMDLDTTIIDDISEIAEVGTLAILKDFYRDGVRRPVGMQSSLMYLPEVDRYRTWQMFNAIGPRNIIQRYRGDQDFLESIWQGSASYYQDLVPNQIVSYKVHCKDKPVPADARLIVFHGKPRPWSPEVALNRTH